MKGSTWELNVCIYWAQGQVSKWYLLSFLYRSVQSLSYSTVSVASSWKAQVAGGCEVLVQTAGRCRPQGRKQPAQQVGYRPWAISPKPGSRSQRRALSVSTAWSSRRRSQPSRRRPPPPLPAESPGPGPVGSRSPPRPSRDRERGGTEGKFLRLPGPAASAAPRVTPGRSYRERAPA